MFLIAESLIVPAFCGGIMTQRESAASSLPLWVYLDRMETSIVIHSQNGDEKADICLGNGIIRISTENGYYLSDEEWIVSGCYVSDIDHDSYDEIMLHIWKAGSFGEFHPFWIEKEDTDAYSEHLFIFDWDTNRPKRLKPMWMSSEMPVKGEYISVDENGTVRIISPDSKETFWRWEYWGLALIS